VGWVDVYGCVAMSAGNPLPLQRLRARKASLAELQAMHSENHVRLYGRPSQRKPGQDKKGKCRATVSWGVAIKQGASC